MTQERRSAAYMKRGLGLALLPFAPIGVWVGVRIAHRINQALFYRMVYTGMFLTAVKLLWDARPLT